MPCRPCIHRAKLRKLFRTLARPKPPLRSICPSPPPDTALASLLNPPPLNLLPPPTPHTIFTRYPTDPHPPPGLWPDGPSHPPSHSTHAFHAHDSPPLAHLIHPGLHRYG